MKNKTDKKIKTNDMKNKTDKKNPPKLSGKGGVITGKLIATKGSFKDFFQIKSCDKSAIIAPA